MSSEEAKRKRAEEIGIKLNENLKKINKVLKSQRELNSKMEINEESIPDLDQALTEQSIGPEEKSNINNELKNKKRRIGSPRNKILRA